MFFLSHTLLILSKSDCNLFVTLLLHDVIAVSSENDTTANSVDGSESSINIWETKGPGHYAESLWL